MKKTAQIKYVSSQDPWNKFQGHKIGRASGTQ